ncbi:MAG: hypothetical protein M0Z94_18995 [Dehalococcoidales bacterium]|nr:hypothetical protein [Dehalococcoidales bacterium]
MKRVTKVAGTALVAGVLVIAAAGCGSGAEPTPTPTQTASPTPAPTQVAVVPTNTPVPVPKRLVVGNTGGDGVVIRKEPGSGEVIKGWADGTAMLVVGDDREAAGRTWKNVKDPDGNEGWVAADFLVVPSAPTPGAQSAAPTAAARP